MNSRPRARVRDAEISRDLQSFFLLQGLRHRTAANAELLLVLLLLLLLPTPMMLPFDLLAIRSGTRNILDGGLLKSTWRRIHHRSHCGRERERSVLVWFHHCIPVPCHSMAASWIDRVTLQNRTLAAPDSHLICRPRAKAWQGENLHRPSFLRCLPESCQWRRGQWSYGPELRRQDKKILQES